MRNLKSLRAEADRLRQKVGSPIPSETLDQLGAKALSFVIEDARSKIRSRSLSKERIRELDSLLEI